jgi:O-antigen ligase
VDQVLNAERADVAREDRSEEQPLVESLLADWRTHVPSLLVLIAVAWWLLLVTRWWGGREPHGVTGGAIATAIAVLATRPDRVLPRRAIFLALAVSGGAILVAATAPTGWAGATNAADYVCAAWVALCVAAAVIRDRRVVVPLLGLVVAGVGLEIRESWLAWWGSESSSTPMIGTFYWHNPFAIYLLPGAVIGFAVWLRRTGLVAWAGLAGFILGSIGIFYSTSRAGLTCFVAAVSLVLIAHLVTAWRAGAVRAAVGVAGSAAVVWAIGGPPFFPSQHHSPVAGLVARGESQSLAQNGGYRLDFWREALGVFSRHPVTGGGYHSMATASVGHNPHHWPLSPLAHNGFLQVLSDGGLLLGVPFLLAVAVVSWWIVTAIWSSIRSRDFGVMGFALPLALGALFVHSAVDFDWSYPADFVLTAILVGLVAGDRWSTRRPTSAAPRWPATAAAVAGVGLLIVSAVVARSGDLHLNLPIASAQAASAPGAQQ